MTRMRAEELTAAAWALARAARTAGEGPEDGEACGGANDSDDADDWREVCALVEAVQVEAVRRDLQGLGGQARQRARESDGESKRESAEKDGEGEGGGGERERERERGRERERERERGRAREG